MLGLGVGAVSIRMLKEFLARQLFFESHTPNLLRELFNRHSVLLSHSSRSVDLTAGSWCL